MGELHRREQRVLAVAARHGAGMAVFAEHAAVLVAVVAADAGDDRAPPPDLHQVRSLLDVHLDIRADALRVEMAAARAYRVRIETELGQMCAERAASVEAHDIVDAYRRAASRTPRGCRCTAPETTTALRHGSPSR